MWRKSLVLKWWDYMTLETTYHETFWNVSSTIKFLWCNVKTCWYNCILLTWFYHCLWVLLISEWKPDCQWLLMLCLLGTGKTCIGVKIAYEFVKKNLLNCASDEDYKQVLFCGPSNSSVDAAASKFRRVSYLRQIRKFCHSPQKLCHCYLLMSLWCIVK